MHAGCKYLLVDGHSVIYQWNNLRSLHHASPAKARETLIRQLQYLHDTSHWLVTLVFDGKQGTQPIRQRKGDMVVLYSTKGQTADSIIEKIVGQQKDRSTILVVTADEAERLTIESFGAFCTSPQWLENELSFNEQAFTQELKRVHERGKWKKN